MYSAWPEILRGADLCLVRFALDFLTPCQAGPATLLGLRRPLHLAGRSLFGVDTAAGRARFAALFDPAPSTDPVAVKKYQKPGPAFVLRPRIMSSCRFEPGDRLELDVLFLGSGIPLIGDLLSCLVRLGQLGLVEGAGSFELAEAVCFDADGQARRFWSQGEETGSLAPDLVPLDLWLEKQLPQNGALVLQLLTPSRLLSGGKPLRQPSFARLFPFLLRRVTTQLFAHCGIEVIDDPTALLAAAARVEADLVLQWQDWRELPGRWDLPVMGGLVGRITLAGDGLDELRWVLGLATLFAVGKSATYGSGQLQLFSQEQS